MFFIISVMKVWSVYLPVLVITVKEVWPSVFNTVKGVWPLYLLQWMRRSLCVYYREGGVASVFPSERRCGFCLYSSEGSVTGRILGAWRIYFAVFHTAEWFAQLSLRLTVCRNIHQRSWSSTWQWECSVAVWCLEVFGRGVAPCVRASHCVKWINLPFIRGTHWATICHHNTQYSPCSHGLARFNLRAETILGFSFKIQSWSYFRSQHCSILNSDWLKKNNNFHFITQSCRWLLHWNRVFYSGFRDT